ncbi:MULTISPECIES: helix-turn-helix domain-containing protein [unclassified Methylobacterium]|uniref:helix-turn-helix domain-containing protein n=1 Tax=unclassified Methylobacterium TaxID=2615210 RepID=UPI00226AD7B4|nr:MULTISPECIES: helix-turn-helix domain-containing protein [unclassified Methylobacterium]
MPQVLVPFSRREGCSVEEAAEIAGKSVRTMRLWCEQHHIGRHVGGGPWVVSRVALEMLLDGDHVALNAYLSGNRSKQTVVRYYERIGLLDLIQRWHNIGSAMSAMAT